MERSQVDNSLHALMCIDIDQFKIINETCGHGAGDTLLHQLGSMIKTQLRTADTLARIGGDEFGIVLENCSLDSARKIADTVRQATRDFRFIWGRRTLEVGFGIGLVSITRDSESVSTLLSAADVACHTAKSAGRHRIHVRNPASR